VPCGPRLAGLGAFTLACAFWPTTPNKGDQALIGTWSPDSDGFVLMIDRQGRLVLRVATDGGHRDVTADVPLLTRTWYLARASHDPATGATDLALTPCPHSPSPLIPATASATVEG
jgi:N,N-dimethylformamidase